jgi:hypothetical protein
VGAWPRQTYQTALVLRNEANSLDSCPSISLCRSQHRELHRSGSEYLWWENVGIDPMKVARKLWKRARLQRERGIASRRGCGAARTTAVVVPEQAVAPVDPVAPGASLQVPKTDRP